MKKLAFTIIVSTFFLNSCNRDIVDDIPTITDPLFLKIVQSDTIKSESYLSVPVLSTTENTYELLKAWMAQMGNKHLHITQNQTADFEQLQSRLPLYNYFIIDKKAGSSEGVQVTLENDKVSAIYLNSGKQFSKWPEKYSNDQAIKVGTSSGELFQKLTRISQDKNYKSLFEQISLQTKDITKAYDPFLSQSPLWYIAFVNEEKQHEEVQFHFKENKLQQIVRHLRQ